MRARARVRVWVHRYIHIHMRHICIHMRHIYISYQRIRLHVRRLCPVHSSMHIRMHMRTHMRICVRMCTCVCMRVRDAYAHVCARVYVHVLTSESVYAYASPGRICICACSHQRVRRHVRRLCSDYGAVRSGSHQRASCAQVRHMHIRPGEACTYACTAR